MSLATHCELLAASVSIEGRQHAMQARQKFRNKERAVLRFLREAIRLEQAGWSVRL